MKNSPSVIKCIKSNKNVYCFGYPHKAGQYVTYYGKGTFDINKATVYGMEGNIVSLPFKDFDNNEWKKYYVIVPVEIVPKKK